MAKELRFDVSALDQASKTFARMGAAVEAFERRLDKLDGKKVDAEIGVKTDQAEREVGRFATDTRKKLQAALSNLPDIQIDANSSDADRKLADIRRRMQELADKTIGVDIDAADAIRDSQQLRRELEELARTSPDIRVQIDAAAASAQLAKVDAEVDRLDGRTARVKVDVDAGNALVQVAQLGRALAQIGIPAGVIAATPAILALGQAAVTASGSLLLVPAAAGAAGLAVGTLKVAFSGFGDAIGDDPKKAAEAMADMAPAAQEAARAVQGLRPAWDALRLDVQSRMFDGLGERISSLGGTYLPILRDSMSRVGESFNFGATQVAMFLQDSQTVSSVTAMFSDMENTVENLVSDTMAPLTSVFVDLGAVGARVLADITQGAGSAAERFAAFISRARETGQLESWMRRGVETLRQLGQVAVNVGASLGSMMRAAGVASGDFLGSLVNLTGRMREFLASAQGQAQMTSLFEGINRAVVALSPGLQAAGRAIMQMLQHASSSGSLEALAGALSDLIVAVAPVVVAFSNLVSAGIRPLASALGFLAPVIGPVIAGFVMMRAASRALSFVAAITGVRAMASGLAGLRTSLAGTTAAAAATRTGVAGAGVAVAGAGTAAAAAGGRFAQARMSAASLGAAMPLVGLAFAGAAAYVANTTASLGQAVAAMNEGGVAADAMRKKVEEQTMGIGENAAGFDFGFAAVSNWARANILGVATVDSLNEALQEQKRQQEAAASAAASAAGITKGAFDQMTGAQQRSAAASKQVTDNLALIGPAMSGIKDGVIPTQEMQGALDATGNSARTAAQEAGAAAQRLGGVGAGADAAAASMQASRDAFIQTATSAGMTRREAEALADRLGLIPETARTQFETNAATTAMEIQQVNDKLRAVPAGQTIVMNALTAPAETALSALGVRVERMPDGTVRVTADTREAQANVDLFVRGSAERRADVMIDGRTMPAQEALGNVLAQVAAGRSSINIDGQSYPAQQVLAYLLGTVGQAKGDVKIGAQTASADQVLSAYLESVRTKNPMVTINGQTYPADQALAALVGSITTQSNKPVGADVTGALGPLEGLHGTATAPATKPVGADTLGGLDTVNQLQGAANASATKPVGADTGAGLDSVAGLQGSAQANATKPVGANTGAGQSAVGGLQRDAQAGATKPVGANTGAATGAVNALARLAAQTVTMTVNVVKRFFGAEGGIVPAHGFADGGLHVVSAPRPRVVSPMADGGAAGDPSMFNGRRMTPMSAGSARIVPPNMPRIIGDRARGDELFLPLVPTNAMSQTLLEVGAQRMGRQLVPAGMRLAPSATGLQLAPMAQGGMVTAAQQILARMRSGAPISEDWSWRGAPAVVGQYNDALLDAMGRAGVRYADGRRWLEDYVRRSTATVAAARPVVPNLAAVRAQVQAAQTAAAAAPQVTVRTGMDVAELRAIHGQLVGLRSDLLTSGRWGPQMVDQLRGLSNRLLSDVSATARAAAGRDSASLGAW